MPFVQAYLVVERRIQGHLQSYELVPHEKRDGTNHLIDVETLAVDVATGVTYFLKNMHERMVISNITIKDSFVQQSEQLIKFDVIHGRQANLIGGIDRQEANVYVDAAIIEKQKQQLANDQLFAEMNDNWGLSDTFDGIPTGSFDGHIPDVKPKNKKKKDQKRGKRRRGINLLFGMISDWWNREPED